MTSLLCSGLPDTERGLTELQLWALSAGVSCWLIDLEPYEPCRVAGRIERLTLDPVAGNLEISVTDGTDWVIVRWALASPTPQMVCVPGRFVVIEGVPRANADSLMILEPQFEVVETPRVA